MASIAWRQSDSKPTRPSVFREGVLVRARHARCVNRLLSLLLLLMMTTAGCGTMFPRYMGVRPDAPSPMANADIRAECDRRHPVPASPPPPLPEQVEARTACERYLTHIEWAQQLAEAYRSRATLNEWSIYFAGTIALVGLALVSGLGVAAAASSETLGLIGASTGFSASFFAFLDNRQRAAFYNEGAKTITTALSDATVKVTTCQAPAANSPACRPNVNTYPMTTCYCEATMILAQKVSTAANTLEDSRYAAAEAASRSAAVQQANQQLQATAALVQTAAVTSISTTSGKEGDTIVITTAGVDLTTDKDHVRVFVAGTLVGRSIDSANQLTIAAPKRPGTVVPFPAVIEVWVAQGRLPGTPTFTYTQ